MVDLLFGTFQAQNVYLAFQPKCAVLEKSRDIGLVVDIGHHSTTLYRFGLHWGSEPVGPWCLDIAGDRLTQFLKQELQQYPFGDKITERVAEDIKKKLCYVSQDFQKEFISLTNSGLKVSYTLPDEQVIAFDKKLCIQIPELLFKP